VDDLRGDARRRRTDEPRQATKRDLVDYLDAVADRILPELADRPLSVIRVHRGQEAFMQKNVPRYTPDWVRRLRLWSESSRRDVDYALCNDRRTLIWFANQRAVEYHPTLVRAEHLETPTHLVIDIDPPDPDAFAEAARAAHLVRAALGELGLRGAVKTSGSKGLHVYVPVAGEPSMADAASATRAIAERTARLDPGIATTAFMKEDRGGKVFIDATRVGWASVISAYSPRVRPRTPVSFPIAWDDLDAVSPREFTIHTAIGLLADRDPWAEHMPPPQALSAGLIEEGAAIPGGRVQAMHEGKRRARAAKST
jgi:bifunctional non-homologous end joining protein LigD